MQRVAMLKAVKQKIACDASLFEGSISDNVCSTVPRDQGFPLTLLTLANLIAGWHAALPIRSWRLVAAGAALLDRHGLLLAAWLAALTAFALLYQQRGAEGESPP